MNLPIFIQNSIIAAAGGILPALLWLLFWLREDRKHPEPKKLLALTFVAGMLVVLPVLKLESVVWLLTNDLTIRFFSVGVIEELGKFLIALAVILWSREIDEPVDFVIYMVTVALGFSALENVLFLWSPVADGLVTKSLITGNLRFIGATLLHIVSSGAIGIALALSFYKKRLVKLGYLAIGLILAITLHASYNLTIMVSDGKNSLFASSLVWIAVIVILLLSEKVKRVHPTKN